MNKFVVFMFLLIGSAQSLADCSTNSCVGEVTEFYFRNIDKVYIRMPYDMSVLNCDLYGGKYVTLEGTHVNSKNIYSALLTAKATKSYVKIRIVENSTDCIVDYVVTK